MASIDDIGVPGQPATNLTAWQAAVRDAIKARVPVTGGTMSGELAFDNAQATAMGVRLRVGGKTRWFINRGTVAESGGNTGSDLNISRYDDAGTYLDSPLRIYRDTGLAVVKGDPTAALGIATKQYVDTANLAYWSNVERTTAVPVASAAAYDIAWEARTVDADQPSLDWTAAGFTIPKAGVYVCRFVVDYSNTTLGGRVGLYITRNNTTLELGDRFYLPAVKALVSSTTAIIPANAGDVISARVNAYEQALTLNTMRLTVSGPS